MTEKTATSPGRTYYDAYIAAHPYLNGDYIQTDEPMYVPYDELADENSAAMEAGAQAVLKAGYPNTAKKLAERDQQAARIGELETDLHVAQARLEGSRARAAGLQAELAAAHTESIRLAAERNALREAVTELADEWEGEADAGDIDAANEPAYNSRAAMQADAVRQRECAAELRKLAAPEPRP
jgi:hypothetical protein